MESYCIAIEMPYVMIVMIYAIVNAYFLFYIYI